MLSPVLLATKLTKVTQIVNHSSIDNYHLPKAHPVKAKLQKPR